MTTKVSTKDTTARPDFKIVVETDPGTDGYRWRQVKAANGGTLAVSRHFSHKANAVRSARLQADALKSAVLV